MEQKKVNITGLTINHNLGIIVATSLMFDATNKLIEFKGGSGNGKTTLQKALQLGTQGTQTLIDNELYGKIDLEVQLTDGQVKLWVSCKSKGNKLITTLFAKDEKGKKINKPIIDGVEATAATYLKSLQTELTWKMDELTSENPNIQKKILLKLYQRQLSKIGVIFDKNHPDFENSIKGKIEKAIKVRDHADFVRKQKGGIADDLKAQGFDPDRPDTCPDAISIKDIENQIKGIEKLKTLAVAEPEAAKNVKLSEIKAQAAEINNKCLAYNSELKNEYFIKEREYDTYNDAEKLMHERLNDVNTLLTLLEVPSVMDIVSADCKRPKEVLHPDEPNYILFDKTNGPIDTNINELDEQGKDLLSTIKKLREQYISIYSENSNIDLSEFDEQLQQKDLEKTQAQKINNIVDAIDSFHNWRAANTDVVRLKAEYLKMLAQVDTGVHGLEIQPIDDDIFLMYDGSYDVDYFQPRHKKPEMRKVSSYSGTQKAVICLLIQSHLLNQKPKAMRYMYIDNIPIDNKARAVIEDMSEKLDMHIFLNVTGDFEKKNLKSGEFLIEGGEVFFNDLMGN